MIFLLVSHKMAFLLLSIQGEASSVVALVWMKHLSFSHSFTEWILVESQFQYNGVLNVIQCCLFFFQNENNSFFSEKEKKWLQKNSHFNEIKVLFIFCNDFMQSMLKWHRRLSMRTDNQANFTNAPCYTKMAILERAHQFNVRLWTCKTQSKL